MKKKSVLKIILSVVVIIGAFLFVELSMNSQEDVELTKTNVSVDFTNLHALVSWDEVKGADGYDVLRKFGKNGTYVEIGNVKAEDKVLEYKDVYRDSFTGERKENLTAGYFVDASNNDIFYTVRPYKLNGSVKTLGEYYSDGDFHLEAPCIVDVKKINNQEFSIEWSTVKNAEQYDIYIGCDIDGKREWEKVSEVDHENKTRLIERIQVKEGYSYFTVKAVATKNGETVYSDFDSDYTIDNRKYENSNVLFFGDSITFGSPYKGKTTRDVFSYPHRVSQLTNIQFYNPSIPGSTYTYKEKSNRSRMIQIAQCLKDSRNVTEKDLTKNGKDGVHASDMYVYKTDFVDNQINGRKFKDFDVVIMAVGTNDYLDDNPFGALDSTNIREFNGAVNTIIRYFQDASQERVSEGKKPIKVVFVDLFYSDRTYDYSQKTNRFITKNKIGLTLTDYQNNINDLVKEYKTQGIDVYQFHDTYINEDNCPYTMSDNLHMNRYAYAKIGNNLAKYLIENRIIEE